MEEKTWNDLQNELSENIEKYMRFDTKKNVYYIFIQNISITSEKPALAQALYNDCNIGFLKLLTDKLDSLSQKTRKRIKLSKEMSKEIEFVNCVFKTFVLLPELDLKINFLNCTFDRLQFYERHTYKLELNINTIDGNDHHKNNSKINVLNLNDNIFKKRINISHTDIGTLHINSCIFNKKFDFRSNLIQLMNSFYDTNFLEHADFHGTKFTYAEYAVFNKVTFSKMAIFEYCYFYELCKFEYVTFESFGNFRNTHFLNGIILDKTNWGDTPNFHEVEISDNVKNTRETFRIIKSAFESSHNKIEANKFHALELAKRKKELDIAFSQSKRENISDWLIFNLQELTSNHGQNWFLPVYWLIIVGLIFGTISYIIEEKVGFSFVDLSTVSVYYFIVLAFILICTNKFIKYISFLLLNVYLYYLCVNFDIQPFFKALSPFDTSYKDIAMLFFINKVVVGYLVYQFLLAVRKDTRK